MKVDYPQLPFPRGKTYKQSISGITPDSTFGAQLEGRVYEVFDPTYQVPIKLRVVRNATGGNLTLNKQCVGFYSASTGYAGLGARAMQINGNGDYVKPVDFVYNGVVAEPNDLFYVIDEGPAVVNKTTGTGTALSAGAKAYANSSGVISSTVSSGVPVGIVAEAAGDSASTVRLYVTGGIRTA